MAQFHLGLLVSPATEPAFKIHSWNRTSYIKVSQNEGY